MANLKTEITMGEAQKYRKNNGIVLRTILVMWKNSKFNFKDLLQALAAYHISKDDIIEALLNFDESGLITTKLNENNEKIELIDCDDYDLIHFAIGKIGREIGYGIQNDPSIEM